MNPEFVEGRVSKSARPNLQGKIVAGIRVAPRVLRPAQHKKTSRPCSPFWRGLETRSFFIASQSSLEHIENSIANKKGAKNANVKMP